MYERMVLLFILPNTQYRLYHRIFGGHKKAAFYIEGSLFINLHSRHEEVPFGDLQEPQQLLSLVPA